MLYAIYRDCVKAESSVQKWKFDLENLACSNKAAVAEDNQTKMLIENNPDHTTWERYSTYLI